MCQSIALPSLAHCSKLFRAALIWFTWARSSQKARVKKILVMIRCTETSSFSFNVDHKCKSDSAKGCLLQGSASSRRVNSFSVQRRVSALKSHHFATLHSCTSKCRKQQRLQVLLQSECDFDHSGAILARLCQTDSLDVISVSWRRASERRFRPRGGQREQLQGRTEQNR